MGFCSDRFEIGLCQKREIVLLKLSDSAYKSLLPCIRSIKAGTTLYISGTTALGSSAVEDIDQLDVILERITRIVESEGRGLKE